MGSKVLAHVVRVSVRVRQADRTDARLPPVVHDHVLDESFTGEVCLRAERALVGTSIDDLLLLFFRNDGGLHRASDESSACRAGGRVSF